MSSEVLNRPGVLAGVYPQREDIRAGWLEKTVAAASGRFHQYVLGRHPRYQHFIDSVESASHGFEALTPSELQMRVRELRRKLYANGLQDELVHQAFAAIREVASRKLDMRHYDVQLFGGWVMLRGKVAEMETGEELLFLRPGLQRRTLRKLRRGMFVVNAELDLHGMTVPVARQAVAEFLQECQRRRIQCARIVHGKGLGSRHRGPVLKRKLDPLRTSPPPKSPERMSPKWLKMSWALRSWKLASIQPPGVRTETPKPLSSQTNRTGTGRFW